MKLTVDEHVGANGASVTTTLAAADGALRVAIGGHFVGDVGAEAVTFVFERYGRPLDDGISPDGAALVLAGGATLRMLRHRARYDVIARDFVVLERPGAPPLTELAITIAGALTHLARAIQRAPGS